MWNLNFFLPFFQECQRFHAHAYQTGHQNQGISTQRFWKKICNYSRNGISLHPKSFTYQRSRTHVSQETDSYSTSMKFWLLKLLLFNEKKCVLLQCSQQLWLIENWYYYWKNFCLLKKTTHTRFWPKYILTHKWDPFLHEFSDDLLFRCRRSSPKDKNL